MNRLVLILFGAAAIVQLTADFSGRNLAHDIAKGLLMPLLAIYYVRSASVRSNPFLAALFFCWVGDILLLLPFMFLGGLSAFLFGHVSYILAYRQHQFEDRSDELLATQKVRFAFPVVLAGTGLIVVLYPVLGALKLPVMVYGLVIIVMVIAALFRYGRTTPASFWLVFGGATFFMVSDAVLAINRFHTPVSYPSFWIMLTYMSAQLMIVLGIVKHR